MARDTRRGGKKKVSKNIAAGVAHVNSSFNNTKILISDVQGITRETVLSEAATVTADATLTSLI